MLEKIYHIPDIKIAFLAFNTSKGHHRKVLVAFTENVRFRSPRGGQGICVNVESSHRTLLQCRPELFKVIL